MKVFIFLLFFFFILNIPVSISAENKARKPDKIELAFDGVQWHSFEGQFRNYELIFHSDGVCANTTVSYYYFWNEIQRNCLFKNPITGKRQFIFCTNSKCQVTVEIEEEKKGGLLSYFGYGSSILRYSRSIFSTKETRDYGTYLKFYNEERGLDQEIAKIEIFGQGSKGETAEKAIIYRFTEDIDMKYLLLIAAQNLKSYARNLWIRLKSLTDLTVKMIESLEEIRVLYEISSENNRKDN